MKLTKLLVLGATLLDRDLRAVLDDGVFSAKAGQWLAYSDLTGWLALDGNDITDWSQEGYSSPYEQQIAEFVAKHSR